LTAYIFNSCLYIFGVDNWLYNFLLAFGNCISHLFGIEYHFDNFLNRSLVKNRHGDNGVVVMKEFISPKSPATGILRFLGVSVVGLSPPVDNEGMSANTTFSVPCA